MQTGITAVTYYFTIGLYMSQTVRNSVHTPLILAVGQPGVTTSSTWTPLGLLQCVPDPFLVYEVIRIEQPFGFVRLFIAFQLLRDAISAF